MMNIEIRSPFAGTGEKVNTSRAEQESLPQQSSRTELERHRSFDGYVTTVSFAWDVA